MAAPRRGLYELLVTEALDHALGDVPATARVDRMALRDAEAADRLALHVSGLVERAVSALPELQRARQGTALARELVTVLARHVPELGTDAPFGDGDVLRAVLRRLPSGDAETLASPLLPLLDTTLLTNAPGEPRVGHQIGTEIASSDRIDVIMAFIRRTGLRPLWEALTGHLQAGRPMRVLTTTYTGSTEARALDELTALGAQVRVSYDTTNTRLHAKAWLFWRASGFSTAYVGSSNLTHAAQVAGLEWNVRVSAARNAAVVDKIRAVFDAYWESGDFQDYDRDTFARETASTSSGLPTLILPPTELRPEPFQARMLEQVAAARARGHHRNLIVSATGTGKTVMAALDYARQCKGAVRPTLLFVAHRKELLEQSLATFRHALRAPAFGSLWVAGQRPAQDRHVFASIQTLSRADLALLASDHFDVVIVDEFHHAAAETYATLLRWLEPKELLGLTATPERADGRDVLGWFDGRITAELRLWDAIDQRRLVPFVYYGLSDGTDLRHVPFRRGQGYDVEGLTNVYTANDIYAGVVLDHLVAHVDDPGTMRALGFCVSVAHAQFMARVFNEAGVASRAVWGGTPSDEREAALQALVDGDVKVLFSVDLFNEGVDLPNVDTLLLLRPTESATLFLQQLGRGLRKATGKAACLVLDMVGHHRQEFRFDLRLKALLRGTRKELEQQVEQGFPFLPAGCHLELDRVVQEVVLRSLRSAIPSSQPARVAELRTLLGRGGDVGLGDYLAATGLAVDDVYSGTHGWSDLLQAAGGAVRPPGPHEQVLRRAVGRLLHVDDPVRTACYLRLLRADAPPEVADLDLSERRLVRMLVGSLCEGLFRAGGLDRDASLQQAVTLVWAHGQVVAELAELFEVLAASGDHLVLPLEASPDLPLGVHARYTRLEILSAFGAPDGARIAKWQTGVRWVPEEQADLLAFTLDKTSGAFSPTTRYRDHAISRDLIHWESQSVVREGSDTGQRYQHHAGRGSSVHLFCRLRQDDRAFWYLGPATYVSHEGERPMAVTWRLDVPLPGDLFTEFAAAVA